MSGPAHPSKQHYGTRPKTLKSYLIGLLLCVILTLAAFYIAAYRPFSVNYLYIVLTGLALTQFVVQVTCFLRLNTQAEGRWNLMPLLFSIIVIMILVGGSMWIMYNLNANMV